MIQVKYLKRQTIDYWLHRNLFFFGSKYLSYLEWFHTGSLMLGWRTDDGAHNKLCINPIVELKSTYILSNDLRAYLNDYGIFNIS